MHFIDKSKEDYIYIYIYLNMVDQEIYYEVELYGGNVLFQSEILFKFDRAER